MSELLVCPGCGDSWLSDQLGMDGHPGILRCLSCRCTSTRDLANAIARPPRVRTELVPVADAKSDLGPYRDGWAPPNIVVHVKSSPAVKAVGGIAAGFAVVLAYLALTRDFPVLVLVLNLAGAAFAGFAAWATWVDTRIELDGEALSSLSERVGRNRVAAIRCFERRFLYVVEIESDDGIRTELTSFEEPEEALYLTEQIESGLRLSAVQRFVPMALPAPEGA